MSDAITDFVGGDSLQMPFFFIQHIFTMFILTVEGAAPGMIVI